MAGRLYLVPVVGSGSSPRDPRRPKYFQSQADGTGTGLTATSGDAILYGFEPWIFVWADLSGADDALVVGQSDAFAMPFDLSATLTAGQVTNVQTKLEAVNVPAGWVTTALTWAQVARTVLWMCRVMQRFMGIHGIVRIFGGAVTLNTTIGSLSASVRTDLSTAATSLGLDVSGITGSTTLRAALKLLADQMQAVPFPVANTFL